MANKTRKLPTTTAAGLALMVLSGAAQAKSDLVIGMNLEPPGLDPTAGAAAAIDEVVYANLFESLTRIDESGAVIPGLAESWTVSDDGLVYTFSLRQGVTYHDGSAFEASDVVFALDRARAEDSVNAQKQFFAPIASVAAAGDHEVIVTLSQPDGLFLFNMGSGDATIVAPESAADNTTHPVGTGPYRFVERVEGDRIVLARNADYVGPDEVFFDTVTFRFITDAVAQVNAMLAGDLDAFPNIGSPESLARFEADARFNVVVGTTEGETVMALNWRREPFNDPIIRQAIIHAIDRQTLIDAAMFGYGTPIGSHFAPHNPAYVDHSGLYAYDPDRSRELLAEAGFADGLSLTFHLPPPAAYARRGGEVIQAMLAEVGIEAELIPVEWGQWLEQVFRGHDFDMTIVSHTEPLDIGVYSRGEDYYFGYVSEAFDALTAALDAATDPDTRAALYADAQARLAEDLASIFLFQLAKTGVVSAHVEGMWANAPIQANDITGARWVE